MGDWGPSLQGLGVSGCRFKVVLGFRCFRFKRMGLDNVQKWDAPEAQEPTSPTTTILTYSP